MSEPRSIPHIGTVRSNGDVNKDWVFLIVWTVLLAYDGWNHWWVLMTSATFLWTSDAISLRWRNPSGWICLGLTFVGALLALLNLAVIW